MQVGDIVAFKGKGLTFKCLSWVLGLFEPKWRKREWKPWHLAVAVAPAKRGWFLVEAIAGGVQEEFHAYEELWKDTRAYRWLEKPPSRRKVKQFESLYIGYPYDVTAYFGVTFAYLLWKVTGKSFRVIDTEHMCWETAAAFCRFMGKPLQPIYEYPVICRIMEKLEVAEQSYNKS